MALSNLLCIFESSQLILPPLDKTEKPCKHLIYTALPQTAPVGIRTPNYSPLVHRRLAIGIPLLPADR